MKSNKREKHSDSIGLSSSRGFTLLELIIVMSLFMVVIIISSEAFNKILSISTQQMVSSESDTQGVIGLEVLRVDLEHAGYGLPWVLGFPAEFDESQADDGHLAPGINSELFNDKYNNTSDTNKVPRAVQSAKSTSTVPVERDRDYLVIKSILAGMSDTNKKWSYVQGIDLGSSLKTWGSNDLAVDEKVITIDSRTKGLVGVSTTAADYSYSITAAMTTGGPPPAAFRPQKDTDVYIAYGISSASATAALRAPYNRVDYYVKRPTGTGKMPTRCAPGTGILYKGLMLHASGGFDEHPLVECVADMQVIYSLDTNGDGGVDLHVAEDGLSGLTAKEIRSQLKEIRVYIVAQEGGKDSNYTNPSSSIYVGEYGSGRTLDLTLFGADYKHYRWKTYKLVVVPKNISY